jgi:hypothetical protein
MTAELLGSAMSTRPWHQRCQDSWARLRHRFSHVTIVTHFKCIDTQTSLQTGPKRADALVARHWDIQWWGLWHGWGSSLSSDNSYHDIGISNINAWSGPVPGCAHNVTLGYFGTIILHRLKHLSPFKPKPTWIHQHVPPTTTTTTTTTKMMIKHPLTQVAIKTMVTICNYGKHVVK